MHMCLCGMRYFGYYANHFYHASASTFIHQWLCDIEAFDE